MIFKCFLSNTGPSREIFAIHFNQAIPRLEGHWRAIGNMERFGPITCLPKKQALVAQKLALLNRGHMATELVNPRHVFGVLVEQLNLIDGLVAIQNRDPYTLEYRTGLLFDATEIGQRIAKSLHEHFFWEQEFCFTVSQDFSVPVSATDPTRMILPKIKDPAVDTQQP